MKSLPQYPAETEREELPLPRRNWNGLLWAGGFLLCVAGLTELVNHFIPDLLLLALLPGYLTVLGVFAGVFGLTLLLVYFYVWQRSEFRDEPWNRN